MQKKKKKKKKKKTKTNLCEKNSSIKIETWDNESQLYLNAFDTLTLEALTTTIADGTLKYFFLRFRENKVWHFM